MCIELLKVFQVVTSSKTLISININRLFLCSQDYYTCIQKSVYVMKDPPPQLLPSLAEATVNVFPAESNCCSIIQAKIARNRAIVLSHFHIQITTSSAQRMRLKTPTRLMREYGDCAAAKTEGDIYTL